MLSSGDSHHSYPGARQAADMSGGGKCFDFVLDYYFFLSPRIELISLFFRPLFFLFASWLTKLNGENRMGKCGGGKENKINTDNEVHFHLVDDWFSRQLVIGEDKGL